MQPTQDLRIREITRLVSPQTLKSAFPMTEAANGTVVKGRDIVRRILQKTDPRMFVVIGPCSIHDVKGALEYAKKLNAIRAEVEDQLIILMRVYFEKPRTTIGWKGLINDPHLNDSCDIDTGLRTARKLLLEITGMGLPAATEFLDPVIPQYIADLISWSAVGARTTESQTHREMASGLSMPVGFKNGTDGSLQVAIDAMHSSRYPHSFLGIDQEGFTSIVRAAGNPDGHVVLRGGRGQTNYDSQSICTAMAQLTKANLPPALMVDCSHANSSKQFAKQEPVWFDVVKQRSEGNTALVGLMVESYLQEGNQPVPKDLREMKYGVSVTDACINWETTERMLREGAKLLRQKSK